MWPVPGRWLCPRSAPSRPGLPEASQLPSGATATAATQSVWPGSTRRSAGSGRSGSGQRLTSRGRRQMSLRAATCGPQSGSSATRLCKTSTTAPVGSVGTSRCAVRPSALCSLAARGVPAAARSAAGARARTAPAAPPPTAGQRQRPSPGWAARNLVDVRSGDPTRTGPARSAPTRPPQPQAVQDLASLRPAGPWRPRPGTCRSGRPAAAGRVRLAGNRGPRRAQ